MTIHRHSAVISLTSINTLLAGSVEIDIPGQLIPNGLCIFQAHLNHLLDISQGVDGNGFHNRAIVNYFLHSGWLFLVTCNDYRVSQKKVTFQNIEMAFAREPFVLWGCLFQNFEYS